MVVLASLLSVDCLTGIVVEGQLEEAWWPLRPVLIKNRMRILLIGQRTEGSE